MGFVEIQGRIYKPLKEYLTAPFSKKTCVYYDYSIQEYQRSGKRSRWVTVESGEKGIPFYTKDNTGSVLVDPTGATIDFPETYSRTSGNRKWTEYAILPNDTAYILGTAGDNPHVQEATGQKNTEDIMIQKGKFRPFYISNELEKGVTKKLGRTAASLIILGSFMIIGGILINFFFFGPSSSPQVLETADAGIPKDFTQDAMDAETAQYYLFTDQISTTDSIIRFESNYPISVFLVKSEDEFNNFLEGLDFETYEGCFVEEAAIGEIRCTISLGGIIVWNYNPYNVKYNLTIW